MLKRLGGRGAIMNEHSIRANFHRLQLDRRRGMPSRKNGLYRILHQIRFALSPLLGRMETSSTRRFLEDTDPILEWKSEDAVAPISRRCAA